MGFVQYLKDTRGELRHVAWPTQRQTVIYTTLVIALSLLTASYLGALDFAFTRAMNYGLNIETSRSGDFDAAPAEDGIEIVPSGEGEEGTDGGEGSIEFDVVPSE